MPLPCGGVYQDILLQATGNLRPVYEGVDWAATPIGPISSWSPSLRSALDLILQTGFPVSLFWGPELVLLYNEPFVGLIADKHPGALGTRAPEFVPEAWDTVGPWMRSVMAGEGAVYIEDALVPLERNGRLQEAYFTFSYSPVRGADGAVEGIMNTTTETTRKVIDRRRLATLTSLQSSFGDLEDAEEVRRHALPILRANAADLPEVDFHLPAPDESEPPLDCGESLHDTAAGRIARFSLGSTPGGPDAVLKVRFGDRSAPDETQLGFLRLIASALSQAIDRITARNAEREIADTERRMSEALQRALLTTPLQPDHLQVAVRYRPAAAHTEVGGDWHDAFLSRDGALTLVVGDVTGHDMRAVGAMAQVRNLLRGVAYATPGSSPAEVLTSLDQAMHGLAVGMYATAILAQVEQTEADVARGLRTLRWSNAGHPPPVLLAPDGQTRLLESPPDALLGLGDGPRADQTVILQPGSSVVFYTDGLVERRTTPLPDRLEWLTGVLRHQQSLSAEALCDRLLSELDDAVEDDVALLVLHVYPEDAPRPSESGPTVLPADLRAARA